MSIIDEWVSEYVQWRERAPEETERIFNGLRQFEPHKPTRALIDSSEGETSYIIPITRPVTIEQAEEALGATALHTVMLADRHHVMLVDDAGEAKGLPMNVLATGLYWQKCGRKVEWVIRGDVLIVPDADYIKDEALRGMYE